MNLSIRSKNKIYYFIIIIACFLTRVPQLVSPELLLDGDESIVAVMAKRLFNGTEFPVYFYGQAYGFSLIECLYIQPFYFLLGINTVAVKLGMLCLWTTGVVFLYKALKAVNINTPWFPILLTLLFICSPAWAVWSMKARGGYLTAFALSNIILWLLFTKPAGKVYCVVGFLLVLVYESQALWLMGLLPIVAFKLANAKKITNAFLLILPVIPLELFLRIYKQSNFYQYKPPVLEITGDNILSQITRIPEMLYVSFHGNYYFYYHQPASVVAAVCSIVTCIAVAVLLLYGFWCLCFNRNGNGLFVCSVLFIPAILFASIYAKETQYRYFLPITGFAIVSFQILLRRKNISQRMLYVAPAYLLIGALSLVTFYSYQFYEMGRKASITSLVQVLMQHDVRYVCSVDCMLPWQLTFYSDERIISRMPFLPGRCPAYTEAVNIELERGGNVTVVAYDKNFGNITKPRDTAVGEFYVYLHVNKEMLKSTFYFPGE